MKKKEIELKVERIKNDIISGSTDIILKALRVFLETAIFYRNESEFQFYIENKLIESKPAMHGIRNIIDFAKTNLDKYINYQNVDLVFNFISSMMSKAGIDCIDIAINRISNFEKPRILTCSRSSLIAKILKKSILMNLTGDINILESNWEGQSYGEMLRVDLITAIQGTKIIIYKDSQIDKAIQNSDIIIVGADSIQYDGSAVNGYPSGNLSINNNLQIPLYVCGESYKLTEKPVLHEGFDLIKKINISGIICDSVFRR